MMDPDKINKWLETAKQVTNGSFWTDIFGQGDDQGQSQPAPQQPSARRTVLPLVDIYQTYEAYTVLIDLPGVRKEDVELSASGEFLFIKGTAKPAKSGATMLSSERLQGPFERSIKLPDKIDEAFSQISAKFAGGVLEIVIPKSVLPRKSIEIK